MTKNFDEFRMRMDEARIPYNVRPVDIQHRQYEKLLAYVSTLKRKHPVWFEVEDWFTDKGQTERKHLVLWGVCAKAGVKAGAQIRCIPASEVADYANKDWRSFMSEYRGCGLFMDGLTEDDLSEKEWLALAKVQRVWRSEQWPIWYTSVYELRRFVEEIMPNEPEQLARFGRYLKESAQVIMAEKYVRRAVRPRQDP